jgi:hypothetical protein
LVYVHDSKLEIFLTEFSGQAIEIGLGPIALRAVLLGKHKDKTLHGARLGVFAILNQ